MRVLTGLDAVRRPPRRAVVTVGVFDGVHLAHQQVISRTIAEARRIRGTSVVITFDPDPQSVLNPSRAQPRLMPLEVRVRQLKALGVDWVWIIPFTRSFSRMTAEQFVRRVLLRCLRAAVLVVGEAFLFGRNRLGDMDVLKRCGPSAGMRVVAVRSIVRAGGRVSSSRIRRLIARGRLAQARGLLGRPPTLYGTVVRGAGRGRRLGFPTANIRFSSQILPPRGVYAVVVDGITSRPWPGAMNFGIRPTFGGGPVTCEVHLLDFSGALRGASLCLSLLAKLRGERCFPSPDALGRQVARDLVRTRRIVARLR